MLFLITSAAILHFHLLTEFENERVKYGKLYKIGITSDEVRRMVSKKLKLLFYTPFAIAIFISMFYGYSIFPRASEKIVSLEYSSAVASIVICLQSCFNFAYEKAYTKRLLKAIEG
jgi:putative ABC transport system permease protein